MKHAIAIVNGCGIRVPVSRIFNAPDWMLNGKTALTYDAWRKDMQSWPELVRDGHVDADAAKSGPTGNYLVRFGEILIPARVEGLDR